MSTHYAESMALPNSQRCQSCESHSASACLTWGWLYSAFLKTVPSMPDLVSPDSSVSLRCNDLGQPARNSCIWEPCVSSWRRVKIYRTLAGPLSNVDTISPLWLDITFCPCEWRMWSLSLRWRCHPSMKVRVWVLATKAVSGTMRILLFWNGPARLQGKRLKAGPPSRGHQWQGEESYESFSRVPECIGKGAYYSCVHSLQDPFQRPG